MNIHNVRLAERPRGVADSRLGNRGVGTILTLRGQTFYESRPMH